MKVIGILKSGILINGEWTFLYIHNQLLWEITNYDYVLNTLYAISIRTAKSGKTLDVPNIFP